MATMWSSVTVGPGSSLRPIHNKLQEIVGRERATDAAFLFRFEHVLKRDIGRIQAIRGSKGKQIPTVISCKEVERVFAQLQGVPLVIAKLVYGYRLNDLWGATAWILWTSIPWVTTTYRRHPVAQPDS